MGPGILDSLSRQTVAHPPSTIFLPYSSYPAVALAYFTSYTMETEVQMCLEKETSHRSWGHTGRSFLTWLQHPVVWYTFLDRITCIYRAHRQSPFKIITGHVLSSQADIYHGSLLGFFTSTSECLHFWFISDAAAIEFSACIHPEFILTVLGV